MKIHKTTAKQANYPNSLRTISSPPKVLYFLGASLADLDQRPAVTIVGSRKVTPYGQRVTTELTTALAGRNITIISGLAMGVDAIAHQAAIEAGGRTVAVLPSRLDKIYPARNHQLAKNILTHGGTLITE